MSKNVLLLAYMFPPIVDAGGFRPAAFARYLPEFGYTPTVVTRPDSRDMPLDANQLSRLPPSVTVQRLQRGFEDGWQHHFRKRLAWLGPFERAAGKPVGTMADAVAWRVARRKPHRPWEVSWMEPAIEACLKLIRRQRPHAIIATAPPFESLKAGWELHRRTGVPLVADFRDPWTYGVLWYPHDESRRASEEAWESRVVKDASRILVVTPSMRKAMAEKYPHAEGRIHLLMNGYEDLPTSGDASPPGSPFTLSYVGTILDRRLPPMFFEGLRRLRTLHPDTAADLRVQFIGPDQSSTSLPQRIRSEGLDDMVQYLGSVGHDECRQLMRRSHVLLHIEPTMWYAITSKIFEYLAAKRPIIGMVPAGSDDEAFLEQSGAGSNAGTQDADALALRIHALWKAWREGRLDITMDDDWLRQFHRREQTRTLAGILDGLAVPVGPTNRP